MLLFYDYVVKERKYVKLFYFLTFNTNLWTAFFSIIMQNSDFYSNAHLFVAAIRVFTHQNSAPPSIDQVCRIISFSLEQGNFICKKLKKIGIVDVVEGGFENRLFIKNHLKIEEIPKGKKEDKFEESLKVFQSSRKDFTQKIESFQAQQAKKQKDLFAELEKKLKKGSNK
jgi:hypothetical protein